MSLVLHRVLEGEDLARVRQGLAEARWKAGKATAGAAARSVKENLQADGSDARVRGLEQFVRAALERHDMFEIAARPARMSRVLFSQYEAGMEYGAHTDDAIMGAAGSALRSDLAFTLFLSERESYEGGALAIDTSLGVQEFKLEAGDVLLYPAGTIHQVTLVTSGRRLAAVGWIQSLVADGRAREILFDLSVARARLSVGGAARGDVLQLEKAISNLLRLWAQP